MYTVYWTLAGSGAGSWVITALIRRSITRRERIAECEPHDRWLDEAQTWAPTYRCRRCPWQEPARDVLAQRQRERQERMDALYCPGCRKLRDDDAA